MLRIGAASESINLPHRSSGISNREKKATLRVRASGPERLKLKSFRAMLEFVVRTVMTAAGSSKAKYPNGSIGMLNRRPRTMEATRIKTRAYLLNSQGKKLDLLVMRHRTSAPAR